MYYTLIGQCAKYIHFCFVFDPKWGSVWDILCVARPIVLAFISIKPSHAATYSAALDSCIYFYTVSAVDTLCRWPIYPAVP